MRYINRRITYLLTYRVTKCANIISVEGDRVASVSLHSIEWPEVRFKMLRQALANWAPLCMVSNVHVGNVHVGATGHAIFDQSLIVRISIGVGRIGHPMVRQ